MNKDFTNFYNNLVHLTRNKNIYKDLINKDSYSDRLIIFLFHFAFFLNVFKSDSLKKDLQNVFDYVFKNLEISIREIGYGDASINKKMKDYINLFHLIIKKIDDWNLIDDNEKKKRIKSLLNLNDIDNLSVYFDKYSVELKNNTLNYYIKSVIKPKN